MKSFYKLKKGRHGLIPQNITTAMMMGLKGLWENKSIWQQANQVKDIVYMRQAMMAVKLVRSWDEKHGKKSFNK